MGYMCDDLLNTHNLALNLQKGKWRNSKPRPILITYPKRREALSIPFRDRVYQRSINDNILYPSVTRSFIYDNAACQKGKGTDFARKRLRKFLWNYFCHHGAHGFVLHMDVKGYYKSLPHDIVRRRFSKSVSRDVLKMAMGVLDQQYRGAVGFNPGSQMVQIAGISVPDAIDHYIKEKLHCKYYIRYQDDFWVIHESEDYLWQVLFDVSGKLNELGLELHQTKTKITPLNQKFRFLGFDYRLTQTGKVIVTIDPANVKHYRKKLVRLAALVRSGEKTRAEVEQCYRSWRQHASRQTGRALLERMDQFFDSLWRS